ILVEGAHYPAHPADSDELLLGEAVGLTEGGPGRPSHPRPRGLVRLGGRAGRRLWFIVFCRGAGQGVFGRMDGLTWVRWRLPRQQCSVVLRWPHVSIATPFRRRFVKDAGRRRPDFTAF